MRPDDRMHGSAGRREPIAAPSRARRRAASLGLAAISLLFVWLWLWLAVHADPSTLFGLLEPGRDLRARALVFDLVVFGGLGLLGFGFALILRFPALRAGADPLLAVTFGFACGLGGMVALFAVVLVSGHAQAGSVARLALGVPLLGIAATLVQTAGEEVFFRGWLLRALGDPLGAGAAVAASAASFGLAHLVAGWEGPVSLVNVTLAGVWFGLLASRTGGLAAPIAAHFAWNAAETHVLGLVPNPGAAAYGTILDFDIIGSPIWGGAEPGLNTSPLETVVLLALIAASFALRGAREPASY